MNDVLPLLPTTMVGAYPRPAWFTDQLDGRDIREAFKSLHHEEAFRDAVRTVVGEQEDAGLDVCTDGQMWFDDYAMGIGAFFWYWFERVGGFGHEKLEHPARSRTEGKDAFTLDESGGVAVRGPIERGPVRLAELYAIAAGRRAPADQGVRRRRAAAAVDDGALRERPGQEPLRPVGRARGGLPRRDRGPRRPRAAGTSSSRTSAPGCPT